MRRIILIEVFLIFFLLPNLYGAPSKTERASNSARTEAVPVVMH
ncbi:MAG TPA: hypothetical protein VMG09_12825 [Bacteroidota bacterium]|nr:hypothetical protein [Bacteroidota bacterium]